MIIFTKASVTWLAGAFFVGKWRWRDVSGIGWVSERCEEQCKKILLDGYDRYQRRNDVCEPHWGQTPLLLWETFGRFLFLGLKFEKSLYNLNAMEKVFIRF